MQDYSCCGQACKGPQGLSCERVLRELQEATVTHYRAFIDMAEGLETTRAELDRVSQHLDGLLGGLPALSEACEAFTAGAAQFSAGRAQNKQLLSERAPSCWALLHCTKIGAGSTWRSHASLSLAAFRPHAWVPRTASGAQVCAAVERLLRWRAHACA